MNPEHPRTHFGPRYPEEHCSFTAEQMFGMSEEEVEAMAEELEDDAEDFYGDEDDRD